MKKGLNSTDVDLLLRVHHETDKAWLCSDDGNRTNAKWLAKSQAQLGERKSTAVYEFTMPEWIAAEKGWL